MTPKTIFFSHRYQKRPYLKGATFPKPSILGIQPLVFGGPKFWLKGLLCPWICYKKWKQWNSFPVNLCLPSLKLAAIAPENRSSQKESRFPTIHFQGRTVGFREGNTWSPLFRNISSPLVEPIAMDFITPFGPGRWKTRQVAGKRHVSTRSIAWQCCSTTTSTTGTHGGVELRCVVVEWCQKIHNQGRTHHQYDGNGMLRSCNSLAGWN